MKNSKTTLVALLSLAVLWAGTADAKKLYVILFGGQSNARGYGYQQYLVETTNALANPQSDVDFYFSPTAYSTQYTLTNLASGSGFPDIKGVAGVNQQYPTQTYPVNRFGPELSLGRTVRDLIHETDSKVAVIKFAQSGTDLYNDWKPDGTANKAADGTVYQAFQTTAGKGITALTNAYPDYQLEILGMGWVQGEADAVDAAGTNYLSYQSNLTTFITDIRATYGSNIIFALSKLSTNQYPITHLVEVRAQQDAVAATVFNVRATETLGPNYAVATGYAEGGLHYLSGAMVQIGQDLGNAIVNASGMGSEQFTLTASVNNVSWGSVVPASGSYSSGTVVQVTATASNGYHLANWTGDASGSLNPLSLTMDTNKVITAVFDANPPATNTLTVASLYGQAVPSVGSHIYTNGIIDCSITNTPLTSGSTQVVCAGWAMTGNSPVSGVTTGLTVVLTNDATLTWLWTTNVQFTATAGSHGSLTGSASGWYALGSNVTVTAVPDSGYGFGGWSGDVSGNTNALAMTITLDRAKTLSANFQVLTGGTITNTLRVDFGLTNAPVETDGNWQGFSVPYSTTVKNTNNVYLLGTSNVTITLASGQNFVGRDRGNPSADSGDRTYSSMYRDLVSSSTASGSITMSIAGLRPSMPYAVRTWIYDYGNASGAVFTNLDITAGRDVFLGAVTNNYSGNPPTNNTMNSVSASITSDENGTIIILLNNTGVAPARINGLELIEVLQQESPASFTLTALSTAGGSVSPTGGVYAAGSEVILTATPSNYFSFTGWSGDASGTTNPLTVSVTSDVTVTAGFTEILLTNSTPQWWLAEHGQGTNDAGALSDTDGDGLAAWEEYIAGTLPNLGSSVLAISNGWQNANGFVFDWPTVPNRVYSVYWSSNLVSGVWSQLSANAAGIYTDTVHEAENDGFYRIKVSKE